MASKNFINRNVSFTERHFRLIEVAQDKGYDRSMVVRKALDLLVKTDPEFFLPSSDIQVENLTQKSTDEQPATELQPA